MTYVVRASYLVRALGDSVLPPLTSKVLKFVVDVRGGGVLAELVNSRRPFKPVMISQLFVDGRPLVSVSRRPLAVPGGAVLSASIAVAGGDVADPAVFESLAGVVKTRYGVFELSITDIEVASLKHLSLDVAKYFKLSFITPTILTAKHMVPPPLKHRSGTLPERHRLIPQPSFIFSYLLKLWNAIAAPEERIPGPAASDWEAYKLGRLADVTLVEVDYSIRPVTVVIGRDSKGRLRTARGFTGWVIYESLSRKLLPIYGKLLALANYLGVGRSRGVGLGMVRALPVSPREQQGRQHQP